jgi:hypothetical protein
VVTRSANSRRQDSAAQYGVRKPKTKHKPTEVTNTLIMGMEPRTGLLHVSTTTVIATTERKTIRATPAEPAGKIEKSLCTLRR